MIHASNSLVCCLDVSTDFTMSICFIPAGRRNLKKKAIAFLLNQNIFQKKIQNQVWGNTIPSTIGI